MIDPRVRVTRVRRVVHGGPQGAGETGPVPVRLDFSANVAPWGPPPAVLRALAGLDPSAYPDPDALEPRRVLADAWDIPLEAIRFSAGAAEWIHRITRTYLVADDVALIAGPTFGEYARAAAIAGARTVTLRGRPPDWPLPIGRLERAIRRLRPRVVFVCAPNNPTGEAVGIEPLVSLADAAEEAHGLLVVDESFRSFQQGEFASPALGLRAVSLRSITKDFALAGLRAGFVTGPPPVLSGLDVMEVPWSASAPAQAAAAAALGTESRAWLREWLAKVPPERDRLAHELERRGLRTRASATNFLLARAAGVGRLLDALAERGIRLRSALSFGLRDHVRIAVRSRAEDDALLSAIDEVAWPS